PARRYGRGRSRPRYVAPSPCSAALARRLFGQSRLARALGELCLDVRERDAARLEHDQQMVDEVGSFGDQARAILLDRRQHGLDRLFAQLLGAMRHALVEELARVGRIGARFRPRLDALFKLVEAEVGHRLCSALAKHLPPPPKITLIPELGSNRREAGVRFTISPNGLA